jgi:hypothetical protein
MTTYTTAALVRTRIEDIDATLVDADIEQYILEAEVIIDCIMKHSLKQTFDAEKHAIVRSLATDMAALSCLTYNPAEYPSPHIAEMTANLLTDSIRLSYYLLNDPATARFLVDTTGYDIMMKVSTTTVAFDAVAATTLYTVPKGMFFIPTMAVIRAGANAAATDVTFGRVGALTDWLGTMQLDNLDADGDQVLVMPVPQDPSLKLKTYAAEVVFQIDVTVAAGGATNYVDLFGYLVSE